MEVPSLAQTHMQGPMKVHGSGKPLTAKEVEEVKEKLEAIKKEFNLKEPIRSYMDHVSPDNWRFGGPPNYTLANYFYLTGRTKQHPEGSLEQIVENLVKTWEMERSHKLDCNTHQSVDPQTFVISANGGKVYNNQEANQVGNYNVLLDACPAKLWDKANISWEESHHRFHKAFAAFPWEVLECFSGPPLVAFTWRHWGHFTGHYEDNQGQGQLVEMFGFGTALVNDKLQLTKVDVYFNAEEFISTLRGELNVKDANRHWAAASCPHLEQLAAMKQKSIRRDGVLVVDTKKDDGSSSSLPLLVNKTKAFVWIVSWMAGGLALASWMSKRAPLVQK